MTLSDKDMAEVVAYVDGELPEAERTAFELRMASDEELADAAESFWQMDGLVRRARATSAAADTPERRPRLRLVPGIALGLAAAAGLFLAVDALLTERIAALSGIGVFDPAADTFTGPPERASRGEDGATAAEMEAWYRTYLAEEARVAERALGTAADLTTDALDGHAGGPRQQAVAAPDGFLVAVELEAEADVVLIVRAEDGSVAALHPDPPADGEAPPTLPAGRHVLPSNGWALTTNPFGGDVPFARRQPNLSPGAGTWEVIVATFPPGSGGSALAALSALRDGKSEGSLLELVREHEGRALALLVHVGPR